jgi:hypothetical protein
MKSVVCTLTSGNEMFAIGTVRKHPRAFSVGPFGENQSVDQCPQMADSVEKSNFSNR